MNRAVWVFIGAVAMIGAILLTLGIIMASNDHRLSPRSECCPAQTSPQYPMANNRGER